MADSPDVSDWISAVASTAAALIAMVTLLTVYIAAMQLATQNRMYRLGLSWQSVGPWERKVTISSLLGLRRRVYSPGVSLNSLVDKNWKPRFTFPLGFTEKPSASPEAGQNVHAKASWVNFMQGLGLSPDDENLYTMQDASELVNGVVPMHWKGKDLVGICSILGFQSYEQKPSYKSPMPLPMQWSGPLGWLQFRSSSSGCVAEFRSRMETPNQITQDMHRHWRARDVPNETYFLRSRLWNSINGFYLPDGKILYLGGADKHQGPRDVEVENPQEVQQDQLLGRLTSADLSDDNILRELYGKKEDRPRGLGRNVERNGPSKASGRGGDNPDFPDFLESILQEKLDSEDKMEVLRPCPGLLSVVVNGELAYSRGLTMQGCVEYDRKFTDKEDVDVIKYPYNLGSLCMDADLLPLMKDALLLLKPDGFYFSPTIVLCADIREAYKHVEEQSDKLSHIYPTRGETTVQEKDKDLHNAMKLCNELQNTRKTARAVFSVDDMQLLAKASSSLQSVISPDKNDNGRDLIWAVIFCPTLSRDVRNTLDSVSFDEFLSAKVHCIDGWLSSSSIRGVAAAGEEPATRYCTPLVADSEYSGRQVLAALSHVFITYYWIDKRWITDVAAYDTTIPLSVTMC